MSLRLEAIHHVAVIATDYARSKHFYAELLGLPVIREHKREDAGDWKIDFQLGEAELELFVKPDAPPRKSYPEAQAASPRLSGCLGCGNRRGPSEGRCPRGAPPHGRLHRKGHVLLL